MGLTDEMRRALSGAGATTPKYGPLPVWCAIAGIGRSKTYEMLADGTLRAIKVGGRLLIDIEHGLATFAAMPPAEIHVVPRAVRAKSARQPETNAA
jgi:excisionase family DNA binding protein